MSDHTFMLIGMVFSGTCGVFGLIGIYGLMLKIWDRLLKSTTDYFKITNIVFREMQKVFREKRVEK